MEIGAGVPRLLWGIGGAVIIGGYFDLGVSAKTGVLTLSFMLAPIMFNGFVDGLKSAEDHFKPQLAALGISPKKGFFRVQLPAARSTMLTTLSIALGRALGDAAALMLTAGLSFKLLDGLDGQASTLAMQIYHFTVNVGGGKGDAFEAAAVLLTMTAVLQIPLLFAHRYRKI